MRTTIPMNVLFILSVPKEFRQMKEDKGLGIRMCAWDSLDEWL